jgi:hypothetical protein
MCTSFGLGCAGNQPPDPGPGQTAAVSISRLTPSSGRAGEAYPIEVTIEGHGFAEEGNTVTFGDVEVPGLESSEGGTRILFWVPKERPSTGEVPPEILEPGEYPVTVTTEAGTSGPVNFILTAGN